ncbi:MAG: biotin--[acetyl-CoA-carboxylase] ligase [Burkholderiales bacterium]|nr:biotin--[acetyl-CoA-carboxylase] ligase [Burkholderiales bacterium]
MSARLARLLPALARLSPDEFRSGEQLARELGISRANLHLLLRQAARLGIDVHAVHGRGYRLTRAVDLLDAERLNADLSALGIRVQCLPELDSTNARLLAMAAEGAPHGSLLAAEQQTQGRGRRGRSWVSPLGTGLTFSLLYRFERPLAQMAGLSLAVGVGLARAIRALGGQGVGLKWPNDLLYGRDKLGGILIELAGDMLGPVAAVIGIGLNVRDGRLLSERVGVPVADLEAACGRPLERNAVLIALVQGVWQVLDDFAQRGFAPLREEWTALHAWQGRPVVAQLPDDTRLEGLALGVDEHGCLLVDDGARVHRLHSAEVSLRLGEAA